MLCSIGTLVYLVYKKKQPFIFIQNEPKFKRNVMFHRNTCLLQSIKNTVYSCLI